MYKGSAFGLFLIVALGVLCTFQASEGTPLFGGLFSNLFGGSVPGDILPGRVCELQCREHCRQTCGISTFNPGPGCFSSCDCEFYRPYFQYYC